MVGQAGMPGSDGGGDTPRPSGGPLQPPVFDPPLSFPAPQPDEDDGDPSTRKRVLWAFGAAAALFGAGIVGLALPNNANDGVNVSTDDTAGSTTVPGSRSEEDIRTLVAPVFAPFTFSVTAPANTTTSSSTTGVPTTSGTVSAAVLAGVVAHGTTSIRISPLPPVINQPTTTTAPDNPDSGTTSPTTARPSSPGTTRPPAPTTTTTVAPTTTTTTLAPETTTTVVETTTTVAETTTTDTTTTTTTVAETTTTAGTTTTFDTTTSVETTLSPPPTG